MHKYYKCIKCYKTKKLSSLKFNIYMHQQTKNILNMNIRKRKKNMGKKLNKCQLIFIIIIAVKQQI